jgi:hypothetical protein
MLKFTFITFLLLLGLTFSLVAQQDTLPICGTVEKTDLEMESLPWFGNNDFLDEFRSTYAAAQLINRGNIAQDRDGVCPDLEKMYLVPIRFWIYKEDDNDNLFPNEVELQETMDRLNFTFQSNGLNIRFFMLCPQYITDSDAANASDWETFLLAFSPATIDPNAINVHIVKEYPGGVYNSFSDVIVIPREVAKFPTSASTLPHEVGHYFGLEHTHRSSDKGVCGQECVSRTRTFNFWNFCLKTGKICEKNGDALCDTPADPNLSKPGMLINCSYMGTGKDWYDESYSPDTSNIMSYSRKTCRTRFSTSQINVMAYNLLINHSIFQTIDANETDPDEYEPDDSDFPDVPRAISMGESQCHTFYDMIECQDPADWLKMSLNQGVIGSYQIKIEKVDDAPNPVEKVTVWNIGGDGMRSTEVATTTINLGSTKIFEFPCSAPSNSRLLIEVVRKSDVTEGKYIISLASSNPLSISGSNILCQSTSYTVEGLPNGATVSWASSPSITLQNTTGSTVTIQSFVGGASEYWVEAIVTWGGYSQKIRRVFSYEGSGGVPNFFIVPEFPACYPGDGEYSISNPIDGITYAWSCQGASCGNIQSFGNGEYVVVEPDGIGTMTLVVTATDECGSSRVKTKEINVQRCRDKMENIIITPNPTTGIINVEIQDTYVTDGNYQVLIISQMSELKFQSDYSTKNFSINLGELQNGVYSILVYRGDTSATATFIINK